MSQHNEPDWLKGEDKRAEELSKSGQVVNNPDANLPKRRKFKAAKGGRPVRTLKGFRIRTDYQQRFDTLVALEKHRSGKKGPDLVEEALKMLFSKYDKKLTD